MSKRIPSVVVGDILRCIEHIEICTAIYPLYPPSATNKNARRFRESRLLPLLNVF
jgi:hypothetical protein